jgi:transposase
MRRPVAEFEWRAIQPLLPKKPRGMPTADDRRDLNGIFWVLRSGSPWRDLPGRDAGLMTVQPVLSSASRAPDARWPIDRR